jgi:indole-3-acetate monooxygenase
MHETRTDNPLVDVARAFRPRILSERDRIEAARRLPEDLAKELARAGLFRIFVPEAHGGLDLAPMAAMAAMDVLEELARADAPVVWCVWNSNIHWVMPQLFPEAA